MNKLRELRKKGNLTQETIAKDLNIARATYAQYELGRRNLNNELLIKLAKYYNVSVDYLIGIDNHSDKIGNEPDAKVIPIIQGVKILIYPECLLTKKQIDLITKITKLISENI